MAHPTSPSKAARSNVPPDNWLISNNPRRAKTARAAQAGIIEMARKSCSDWIIELANMLGFFAKASEIPSNRSRHDFPTIIAETSSSGTEVAIWMRGQEFHKNPHQPEWGGSNADMRLRSV